MAGTKVIVAPEPGAGRGWIVDQAGPTPQIATLRTHSARRSRGRGRNWRGSAAVSSRYVAGTGA